MTKNSKKSTSTQLTVPNRRPLNYVRDTSIEYPELWMHIWITGPQVDQLGFAEMFTRSQCWKAESPEKADLIVFTGGDDINPALYGATPHSTTCFDDERDRQDLAMYNFAYQRGIPMLGVCRGAQLGWALNGGTLYQHVDNHCSDHYIACHDHQGTLTASSVHHQAVKWDDDLGADMLAWTYKSSERHSDNTLSEVGSKKDVEAFFIRESCFLGVQFHPEYTGYHALAHWTVDQILHLIAHNPDIEVKNQCYRIKECLMKEREYRLQEAS